MQDDAATLKALGFKKTADGCFLEAANLTSSQKLQPGNMLSFPKIDAVAVSSIYRSQISNKYLDRTLRSLCAQFPKEAIINVLVGNTDDAYVEQTSLAKTLALTMPLESISYAHLSRSTFSFVNREFLSRPEQHETMLVH